LSRPDSTRSASSDEPAREAEGVAVTASGLSRKVTSSGVIWVQGCAYYVSRRLAGSVIPIGISDGKLVIDVAIPLHKVYRLPKRRTTARTRPAADAPPRRVPNGRG
jgi:hypothetical protein